MCIRDRATTLRAGALISIFWISHATAEPYVPSGKDDILEVLPTAIAASEGDRIRSSREQVEKNPGNVELAVATALEPVSYTHLTLPKSHLV